MHQSGFSNFLNIRGSQRPS